jgi:hypothetical protein
MAWIEIMGLRKRARGKRRPRQRKLRGRGKSTPNFSTSKAAHDSISSFKPILDAMQDARNQEREAFRKKIESLRDASPKERAEGYLEHWANRDPEWTDQEAVVYLISRGYDCTSNIRAIQSLWHDAVKTSIQRLIAGAETNRGRSRSSRKSNQIHRSILVGHR